MKIIPALLLLPALAGAAGNQAYDQLAAQAGAKAPAPRTIEGAAVGAAGAPSPAGPSSEFCVASVRTNGESEFPRRFNIDCGGGVRFNSESVSCWTFSRAKLNECAEQTVAKLKTLMRAKGYAEGVRFGPDYVFGINGAQKGAPGDFCLAQRKIFAWSPERLITGLKIENSIDCGDDGATTHLTTVVPDKNSMDGLVGYMAKKGYAYAGAFQHNGAYFGLVLFRRR